MDIFPESYFYKMDHKKKSKFLYLGNIFLSSVAIIFIFCQIFINKRAFYFIEYLGIVPFVIVLSSLFFLKFRAYVFFIGLLCSISFIIYQFYYIFKYQFIVGLTFIEFIRIWSIETYFLFGYLIIYLFSFIYLFSDALKITRKDIDVR
jgi:hypothetical protein